MLPGQKKVPERFEAGAVVSVDCSMMSGPWILWIGKRREYITERYRTVLVSVARRKGSVSDRQGAPFRRDLKAGLTDS